MRLTLHTDYGLRLLMQVTLHQGQRCTIRDVAESFDISRNHLMKIANLLQQRGYLIATRGKGGGLALALPAAQIRLGDLVCTLEPDMALAECLGEANGCVVTSQCRLTSMLVEARQTFIDSLNRYTLEDICRPRQQALRSLLGIRVVTVASNEGSRHDIPHRQI
jgi:Rrf2 family transcriptional regulator, nitric oxide-sensitive transcriptional repressor